MVCICLYIDPCMENSTRVISLWWSRVKYLLIEKLKERDKLDEAWQVYLMEHYKPLK